MQNNTVAFFEKAGESNRRFISNLAEKARRMNRSRVLNVILWVLIIAASFAVLYADCLSLGFESDDLAYLHKIELGKPLYANDAPISGIKDILVSQYNHWLCVNGRTVAHLALQLAMYLLREPQLDALCAAFTVILALLMARYRSYGYPDKKMTKTDYLLAYSLLVLFAPERSDTLVWNTGVFNYCFPMIIVLLFFTQYMRLLDDTDIKRSGFAQAILAVISLLGGVIAGWTNENIAPTMVCAMIFIIAYRKIVFNRHSPLSAYTGIIGAIAGCCLMILAPGYHVRTDDLDSKQQVYNGGMRLAIRLYYMERAVFDVMLPAIATIIALLIVTRLLGRNKLNIQSSGLLTWSALSFFAMFLSPSFPTRAAFGTVMLMIIPILSLFSYLRREKKAGKYIVPFSLLLFAAANAQLLTEALYKMLKID